MGATEYDGVRPSGAELVAIEAEWPVIEAELAVVEAECRLAVAGDVVAVRAHRRAVAELADVVRRTAAAERAAARSNVRRLAGTRSPFPGAVVAPFAA